MLHTTLRQLGIVSGRAILAIGLTSATILALAPSAKASGTGDLVVDNLPAQSVSFQYKAMRLDAAGDLTAADAGSLTVTSNTYEGYMINVSAAASHAGFLRPVGTLDASRDVAYTLHIATDASGTSTAAFSPTATPAKIWESLQYEQASAKTLNVELSATMTPALAGVFKDTVTFSIAPRL